MSCRTCRALGLAGVLVVSFVTLVGSGTLRTHAQPSDPGAVVAQFYAALKAASPGAAIKLVRTRSDAPLVEKILKILQNERLFGHRPRAIKPAALAQCERNQSNLAIAMEMYSTDNEGRFPRVMSRVVPTYLKMLPTCPAAGRDTYSSAFRSSSSPDAYTIACGGTNHADVGLPAGFPIYTSTHGPVSLEGMNLTIPTPKVIWAVQSATVVSQKVQGDRADVRVDEVYTLHGYPVHVLVDLVLRRDGTAWRIEPISQGDLLLGALKDVVCTDPGGSQEQRVQRETRLHRILVTNGVGWTVLALCGSRDLPSMTAILQRGDRIAALANCKNNLKNLGIAQEMYSTDNGGRFARKPTQLTPTYLKRIPTCPAAGTDTYSAGFASASNPDAYTIVCSGSNHTDLGVPPHYPQYTSDQGILCPDIKEATP